MDSSHFVSQTVCTTLDMTKRRPYAPLYLQYRCHFMDLSLFAETQHMRGYDSQMTAESSHLMLPLLSGKGVFTSSASDFIISSHVALGSWAPKWRPWHLAMMAYGDLAVNRC